MTLPSNNKRILLAKRPERGPINQGTFRKDATPLKTPGDGEVVIKIELLSTVSCVRVPWPETWCTRA
jgi:NADPH-dependent curcumin reductase CurA